MLWFLFLDGMFAILVPMTLLPLITTLFWAESRAKQLGILPAVISDTLEIQSPISANPNRDPNYHNNDTETSPLAPVHGGSETLFSPISATSEILVAKPEDSIWVKVRCMAEQLDVVGLTLLGTAVALILLPLTLSRSASAGWKNGNNFILPSLSLFLVYWFGG